MTSRPAWSASAARCLPATTSKSSGSRILGVMQNIIGPEAQPHPRAARGRPARQHRRHPRHERQPGLHRRPARRRRVLFARLVSEGTHRRHHAHRRDDRRPSTPRAPHATTRRDLALTWPATPAAVFAALGRMAAARRVAARRLLGRSSASWARQSLADLAPQLRPIGAAFVISGFDAGVDRRSSAGALSRPSASGQRRRRRAPRQRRPLRPGDPVGMSLVRGDFELGATGTVTHVDGNARLRLRPSVPQPRPDATGDDPGARRHGAAEPRQLDEDREPRAASSARSRRTAPRPSAARSAPVPRELECA